MRKNRKIFVVAGETSFKTNYTDTTESSNLTQIILKGQGISRCGYHYMEKYIQYGKKIKMVVSRSF